MDFQLVEIGRIIFILTIPLFIMAMDNVSIGTSLYLFHTLIYSTWFLPAHSDSIPLIFGLSLPYYLILSILFLLLGIFKRISSNHKRIKMEKTFKFFFIVFILSIIYSLPYYGTKSIHDAGGIILFLFPTIYFLSFKYDLKTVKSIFKIYTVYVIILLLIFILRYINILPINPYYLEIIEKGYAGFYRFRLLSSAQGMDLIIYFLATVLLILTKKLSKLYLIISLACFFLCMIIQQRAIYLIAFISLFLIFIYIKKLKSKIIYILIVTLIGSGIIFLVTSLYFKNIFYQSILEQGIYSMDSNTFTARLLQSQYLISIQLQSIYNIIFGYHFGASQSSMIFDKWVDFSIHLFHYQVIYQGGLFLFIFYFIYQCKMLKITFNNPIFKEIYLGNILFSAIVFNILLCFTTSPSHIIPVVNGMAISIFSSKKSVS